MTIYTIDYVTVGDCLPQLQTLRRGRRTIFLTDRNVASHYPALFQNEATIVIEAGEGAKTFDTYQHICKQMFDLGADRATLIVGVGGGVVTDMAGFVGATYMRGISFGFVATTLMAQVDASLGGKNGVDVEGYKNIIGTFSAPEFVLCDPLFFATLPPRELRAGYAEVIKYGLLDDLSILDDEQMVARCAKIKMEIVAADFRDGGRRKLLNLGHTFAHAIEKCSSAYNHGEAVAIGLCIMARISATVGGLAAGDQQRVHTIIERYDLPTICPEIAPSDLLAAAKLDKKRTGDGVEMILLRGFGDPYVHLLSFSALGDAFNAQC